MNKIDELMKKFDDFEKKINLKKFPRVPVLKLSLGLISLTTLTYFIFRPQINKYLSKEGTNITQNIVESKELQITVRDELVKIVNDKYTQVQLANLTKQIINDEFVQNEIVITFNKLLQRKDVNDITKKFVIDIINSEEVENAICQQIDKISKNDTNNKNIGKIIKGSVYHSIFSK